MLGGGLSTRENNTAFELTRDGEIWDSLLMVRFESGFSPNGLSKRREMQFVRIKELL